MNIPINPFPGLSRLLVVECLKLKRTSTLLMVFALPLLVVLFSTGLAVKSQNLAGFDAQAWQRWWMGVMALWSYFMLPMFIALITGAINGNEHKNHGWCLMLVLPVNLYSLYIAKLLLGVLLTASALLWLWLSGLLATLLMTALGAPGETEYGMVLLNAMPALMLTSLPVLIIQHAVSWRFGNIIVPLSVAVMATMGIVQIGSSEYWVWYPWSYMTMSAMGGTEELRHHAVWLSLAVATGLFWLSTLLAASHKRAG